MARQQRTALRRRGRLRTGVSVGQTAQPSGGQFDLPLRQPQFALHQGDDRQVVDRRHVPYVHQALDFAQQGEGAGVVAVPPFQAGQRAIADHQADVAAMACFVDAGLELAPRLLRLQRQTAQVALDDQQAAAHRGTPLPRHAFDTGETLAYFLVGPVHFATRQQHPCAIAMHHRLEHRVAEALRQFQGFAVEATGTPQVAAHDGQVGQGRKTEQTRPEAARLHIVQGLAAVSLGGLDVAAATGDHPGQRLPLRQQVALGRRIGGRQEARQLQRQFFRRVELAGQGQRPAVQHDQTRGAGQQAVRQVHLPAQQRRDILFGQQLFFRQALHQARRHFRMAGAQGLLDGFVEQAAGTEPAAGAQVQRRCRRP
ncbi:hypothetical protein D3C78_1090440 [compost metagenome]